MKRTLRRQRGFTLIELMMASVITFLLGMVCVSLMQQSSDLRGNVQTRLRLNAQARQAFGVIGEGAVLPAGSTGTDGTRNVYGLHGRYAAQTGSSLRQSYQLSLPSNGWRFGGDSFASKTITCKGPANPLPDCTTAGTTKTVNGWLGADPVLNQSTRSVRSYTVESTITLTNPNRAVRAKRPDQASDTYQNIFTTNREVTADNP